MTWAETELGKSSTPSYASSLPSLQELIRVMKILSSPQMLKFATTVQEYILYLISVSGRCKPFGKANKWLAVHCDVNTPPSFWGESCCPPPLEACSGGPRTKPLSCPPRQDTLVIVRGDAILRLLLTDGWLQLINTLICRSWLWYYLVWSQREYCIMRVSQINLEWIWEEPDLSIHPPCVCIAVW